MFRWSKAADCRTPRSPKASAGSLVVGRVGVQKTLVQLPAQWYVKPGPGVSAGLLVGRAGSWSLVAGCRGPRAGV